MKITVLILLCTISSQAQELFVYTEPASNMPARSIGIRLNNWLMDEPGTARINYHFIPEVMWGVNKRLMIHMEGFFSNRKGELSAEGIGLYAKYRILSNDRVYYHFRMAVFGRFTTNNADIHQEEIETFGHNTGYQAGLIATQLLHKTALSSTIYYEQALNNQGAGHEFPNILSNKAINYSLSGGRLLWPKQYTGFKQTNINIMAELLGQHLLDNNKQYLDIGVAVQFIFNSQTRVDIGYKRELYSNMQRTSPNGLLIRVEHLLFNVL
ncbi:MAG: hypothetical protein H0X33_05230 [Taibaiella sp.]|nr:hypothetical protein [Taibaiella sp.]